MDTNLLKQKGRRLGEEKLGIAGREEEIASLGARKFTPQKKDFSYASYGTPSLRVEKLVDGLPIGASILSMTDRRRIYANPLFLKFFRGTSLKSLGDLNGLKTEDYHTYNDLQLASIDRRMAGLEKALIARGGPGYNIYDQVVVLPGEEGFMFYNAHLRPLEQDRKRVAIVWYFQETTSLQGADKVLEAYLTAYRERGKEKEGVFAFLTFFGLQDVLRKEHQTKQYVRILLGKLCRDKAKRIRERMYRAQATLVTYAAHINRDLDEAGVTVRDVRQHVESKLRATQERESSAAEDGFWHDSVGIL